MKLSKLLISTIYISDVNLWSAVESSETSNDEFHGGTTDEFTMPENSEEPQFYSLGEQSVRDVEKSNVIGKFCLMIYFIIYFNINTIYILCTSVLLIEICFSVRY